jgi:hypothetical protein
MNWTLVKALTVCRRAAALGFGCALLLAMSGEGLAQSNQSASKQGLEGVWFVEVTLRNCATDAPVQSFNSLVTFHRGGTAGESSGSLSPGQRTDSHGTWSADGRGIYREHLINLVNYFTPPNIPFAPGYDPNKPVAPAFFPGWSTITVTIELTDPDHLISRGINEFYKADGSLYLTGCSTAVGQRFT